MERVVTSRLHSVAVHPISALLSTHTCFRACGGRHLDFQIWGNMPYDGLHFVSIDGELDTLEANRAVKSRSKKRPSGALRDVGYGGNDAGVRCVSLPQPRVQQTIHVPNDAFIDEYQVNVLARELGRIVEVEHRLDAELEGRKNPDQRHERGSTIVHNECTKIAGFGGSHRLYGWGKGTRTSAPGTSAALASVRGLIELRYEDLDAISSISEHVQWRHSVFFTLFIDGRFAAHWCCGGEGR